MSLPDTLRPGPAQSDPRDAVFERWAAEDAGETVHVRADGFLWLPSRGMGRLPTSEPPYDADYFQNYVKLAGTPMGRAITSARVDLVRRYVGNGHVTDVGVGCGAFIMARMGWTWGYDVNPAGVAWLHSVGRWCDPYDRSVSAVTLWDVIEHLEQPAQLLANVRRWVVMSLPIVPDAGPPSTDWKHYKPREHCWYWTDRGLVNWMAEHGFGLRDRSRIETQLGRQDIGTYVFERERGEQ